MPNFPVLLFMPRELSTGYEQLMWNLFLPWQWETEITLLP
jgi:hypothetical protein